MLKKMKCFMVLVAVIIGVLAPQTALAAPSDVKVFLDGQEIVYDVPPQIIASRTMVPLSRTIEAITGSPASWNGDTKTVTFYAGGHTNVHKIGEKIVYVDGKAVTFDSPSMIIDSRTLVPIRMIAETSGCTVDWDGTNRYVIITSAPSAPPANETPKILGYTIPGGKNIEDGSAFTVNITTNGAALYVWVEQPPVGKYDGGQRWKAALVDAGNTDGQPKWEVTCYALITSGPLTIYANSNETTVGADTRIMDFTVTQAVVEEARILSVTTPNGKAVEKGSELIVNVTTNGAAKTVWAVGKSGEKWTAKLIDTGNLDGIPKWEISCYPSKSGDITVYANKNSSTTNAAKKTVNVTVTEKVQAPKIVRYTTPNGTEIDDEEDFVVIVTVNSSVEDVWVENRGGDRWQGTLTDAGNADGQPKWTVVCNPPLASDRYYIYAQSSDPSSSVATEIVNVTVNK